MSIRPLPRLYLITEFGLIFVALPTLCFFHIGRLWMAGSLWLAAIYAWIVLHRMPAVQWRDIWHGVGWSRSQRRNAILRFAVAVPLIVGLTFVLAPQHLFQFPLTRPGLWLIVLLVYPIASALPQELLFRSFFFRRYRLLLPRPWLMIAANTLCFSLLHLVFHNWVSPLLATAGNFLFCISYRQHQSLKWAVLEHAAYGWLIFTVGIGFYFVAQVH